MKTEIQGRIPYTSVDVEQIERLLSSQEEPSSAQVDEICSKAEELAGLEPAEVATLLNSRSPALRSRIFEAARKVKGRVYGPRLVLFAPLYISNLCANECLYCAFRASNRSIHRKALSQEEIALETSTLIKQGHKRVLMVAGESYPKEGLEYIYKAMRTVYDTKVGRGEIRRINLNIAPLSLDEFRTLKDYRIGTYQLFQETYHPEVYRQLHRRGPKSDYGFRLDTMDRAMEAGIEDVGIGILFGLADYRWEILALMQHIRHLEERFGMGPHTISVPRLEPADGAEVAATPPNPVDDDNFKLIIATLRLAVPYTGIILSTRETAEMRAASFDLGVSQISAGSRTNPGGYSSAEGCGCGDGQAASAAGECTHAAVEGENVLGTGQAGAQFSLGDHRPLDDVIRDICTHGHIPSFCTGCYRLGRTGHDFMEVAKPGNIKTLCMVNALTSFQEYLEDYGSLETRGVGQPLIERLVGQVRGNELRMAVSGMIERVKKGERDLHV